MIDLFKKFIGDLKIPKKIIKSLGDARNNEELKIFSLSIPDLLYPDTFILAGRLFIYLHIVTSPKTIKDYVNILENILRSEIKSFMLDNNKELDQLLEETYFYNFKNHNILSASSCVNYLLKISQNDNPVETPCQLMLRQAVQFYYEEGIDQVIKCYRELVDQNYVHASPTMFNAGTKKNQMSSCFLLTLGDNLESLLYSGAGDVGLISKLQGGIGLSMNAIRHSDISNSGKSSGVLPFGKIYDATIMCVDQGGKRNGAMTITLNDWHIDFPEFIRSRDNYTQNGIRFKQANICAYISNLFMERVKQNKKWTLFCPANAIINGRTLLGKSGQEFEELYVELEKEAVIRSNKLKKMNLVIQEREREINSKNVPEYFMLKYHQLVAERLKIRKKIIDYKVLDAREIYNTLCDMHIKSSMPYVVYRDPVNFKNNMKNIGPTEGLNLCVTPETLVLTDNGNTPIIELCDKKVNVWNGEEFSNVVVKKTGSDQKILKISFSDGSLLECTHYHKFFIQTSYNQSKPRKGDILKSGIVKIIEAKNLEKDMKLVKCSYPIIDKGEDMKYAYTSGFFTGDGTYNKKKISEKQCSYKSQDGKRYCKRHLCYEKDDDKIEEMCQAICYTDKPSVTLYGDKIKLLERLDYRSKGEEINNKLTIQLDLNIKDKFYIPFDKSLKSKMEWLSGYADADGCIVTNCSSQSLQISCVNQDFLTGVKMMLQTCGCNPKISVRAEEAKHFLPDGNGGKLEYYCKKLYGLMISCTDLQLLSNNGFKTYRLNFEKRDVQRESRHFVSVESIIDLGRISDTYCFTEHKRNAGIFNGVLTSQCLEITEPSTPDSIASCNLGHVNLKKYVVSRINKKLDIDFELKTKYDFEGLGRATRSLVRNINKVIDYNYYPLDIRDSNGEVDVRGKISTPNFENRPIGIGVSGLSEVFAMLGLPYDSEHSIQINKMIFACMYYNALFESNKLAKELGEYKNFRTGFGEVFINGKFVGMKGSPLSNGFFQFDLWKQEAEYLKLKGRLNEKIYDIQDNEPVDPSDWGNTLDIKSWDDLRKQIMNEGVRNSMLMALMPTASSAQMLRNAETTEAHQTLIYSRKLVHGNFTSFSEPFVNDMIVNDLWNKEIIEFIMMCNGSIQQIDRFIEENPTYFDPCLYEKDKLREDVKERIEELKLIHRGMYEISQKVTMQMARQRGIYVCQSQSLNIFLPEPDLKKIKAVHTYSNALQLKTGMYYLRQNPASQTNRFTIDLKIQKYHSNMNMKKKVVCTDDVCIMCQ